MSLSVAHSDALVQKLGRGVVYYGSARLKRDSVHWQRAVDLGREVSQLLGSTTWSGGGPGMMEAASQGAIEVRAGNQAPCFGTGYSRLECSEKMGSTVKFEWVKR
jgi:predicted Rossmann-fold nucleotide-binding protein